MNYGFRILALTIDLLKRLSRAMSYGKSYPRSLCAKKIRIFVDELKWQYVGHYARRTNNGCRKPTDTTPYGLWMPLEKFLVDWPSVLQYAPPTIPQITLTTVLFWLSNAFSFSYSHKKLVHVVILLVLSLRLGPESDRNTVGTRVAEQREGSSLKGLHSLLSHVTLFSSIILTY